MSLVNADGALTNDRTNELKAFIGWQIPKVEIAVNGYFRSITGGTYAPYVQLSGSSTNYSTTGYFFASSAGRRPALEPRGSQRLPTLNILDLRAEKIFTVGGDHKISVYADIFNALNNDTITSVFNNVGGTSVFNPPPAAAGTTTVVPYGGPGAVTAPRQIQVGARWTF